MDSETQRAAPLREIENNISALLRGDIAVARIGEPAPGRRPVGFRTGVHKSESAKEMLLSQLPFGPLPATPPSSPENVSCKIEFRKKLYLTTSSLLSGRQRRIPTATAIAKITCRE
jgi:hypothetical protein